MTSTIWTYEDFLTYLYLHAMHTDFVMKDEELEYVLNLVGEEEYRKVEEVFGKQSDYERSQTISRLSQRFCQTQEQRDLAIDHLKDLFRENGEFNDVEQAYLVALRNLLK